MAGLARIGRTARWQRRCRICLLASFFKETSGSNGHPAGDAVLVKVASRLRSRIRTRGALDRYGGEGFLVVLPDSSIDTAMAVSGRTWRAIALHPETIGGDTVLNLTISVGVVSADLFPTTITGELISCADTALYAVKNAGRNYVMRAKAG